MFLLTIPQPPLLALSAHTTDPGSGGEPVSTSVYIFVLTLACLGGAGHGVAMALRKKYGEGIEKYWLEWRWWVGTILDGFSGVMIWPAMPYVAVAIFAPLIIVIQLGSSYTCGLILFKEKCIFKHNLGLFFAVAGIIGVSLSTSHQAAHFTISEFWAGWVNIRFLATSAIVLVILCLSWVTVARYTTWALVAAFFEGIQYICSRSIVDSIFEQEAGFLKQPAVLAAFVIKGLCILGILHSQQLGLEADLSRFAAIYLVGCTMFMCIYGWAFFGDAMPMSASFFLSAISTLAGIYLLNQREENEEDAVNPEDEGSAKGEIKGNPEDDAKPLTA